MDDILGAIVYPDINAKKKNFTDDMLSVREIFLTVQGEMPYAGQPAVFIRLGGCNRGNKSYCNNCDTDFRLSKSTLYTPKNLLSTFLRIYGPQIRLIVITGGEPLLQEPALKKFLRTLNDYLYNNLHQENIRVQFETNGDYVGEDLLTPRRYMLSTPVEQRKDMFSNRREPRKIDVSMVVSPKEPFSKNPWFIHKLDTGVPYLYSPPTVGCELYVRRIVSANKNSAYHRVPAYLLNLPTEDLSRVYLSGITIYEKDGSINGPATKEHAHYAADLAIKYGLRVSWQTHAYLGIR